MEREKLRIEDEMASVKAAQMAAESEMKRQQAAEKAELDRQSVKQKEKESKDKGDSDKRTSDIMGKLTDAINAPREIVRDSSGKAVGVKPAKKPSSSPSPKTRPKKT